VSSIVSFQKIARRCQQLSHAHTVAQFSGVTTDPADPAMRGWGGGATYEGPKSYGIIFSLKISQGNYHADVRCDE